MTASFSSISMSRNSSESKTSPHSMHSTYSTSSWRETIRTLGCLQGVAIWDDRPIFAEAFAPDCIEHWPIVKERFDKDLGCWPSTGQNRAYRPIHPGWKF